MRPAAAAAAAAARATARGGSRRSVAAASPTTGALGVRHPTSSSSSFSAAAAAARNHGRSQSASASASAAAAALARPLQAVRGFAASPEGGSSSGSSSGSSNKKERETVVAEVLGEEIPGAKPVATDIPVDDAYIHALREKLGQDQDVDAAAAAAAAEQDAASAIPETHETVKGEAVQHDFQAETRKLLDIVAHSLYTDKEVFVRELISNASDALEKLRYARAVGEATGDAAAESGGGDAASAAPLAVNIVADAAAKTLTIQDTGIGMSKEDMVENLGRIGRSGSLEFLKQLQGQESPSAAADSSLQDVIGKFGVGFYSVFMVSRDVRVYSRSAADAAKDGQGEVGSGWCWSSDGSGSYSIQEADGVQRGTKIVISLDGDANASFASRETVASIIKKYSNFVGFDINVNGQRVNSVRALWTLPKNEVTDAEHKEFYQFISHAYDEPRFKLMYTSDAPIHIRSLFYVGHNHNEKFGMGRVESGVSLFCRKVLIQHRAEALLPDWLRFVQGVVDSEDIPLNLSREHLQDSALIRRMNAALTRRILRWLADEAKRDPQAYNTFFRDFGFFLKEGAVADAASREPLAKLLRFESSKTNAGDMTGFEDYMERAGEDQTEIFYVIAPNRALAEQSPYMEAFKEAGTEVVYLYTSIDDFVMTNIKSVGGKKLVSIESADAVAGKKKKKDGEEDGKDDDADSDDDKDKSPEWVPQFNTWMKEALGGRVSSVRETTRLRDFPAIVVDHESASFRRMMRHVDPERAAAQVLGKQQLEINPKHPIIQNLNATRATHPELAQTAADQVFDNALVQAGLLDDARSMVPRVNKILEQALAGAASSSTDDDKLKE